MLPCRPVCLCVHMLHRQLLTLKPRMVHSSINASKCSVCSRRVCCQSQQQPCHKVASHLLSSAIHVAHHRVCAGGAGKMWRAWPRLFPTTPQQVCPWRWCGLTLSTCPSSTPWSLTQVCDSQTVSAPQTSSAALQQQQQRQRQQQKQFKQRQPICSVGRMVWRPRLCARGGSTVHIHRHCTAVFKPKGTLPLLPP